MFFKMLKNDMKQKKGLNIILFIFISVASLLVFTGAVQIYSSVTQNELKEKMCLPSDMLLFLMQKNDPEKDEIGDYLDGHENVTYWYTTHMSRAKKNIDFPDFDEKDPKRLYNHRHYLTTLPREKDLAYDLNDEPFYVPNGCIAVPERICRITGTKVGDIIKYTTPAGNVYELEVSCIYKDNSVVFLDRFIVSDADYEILTADDIYDDTTYCVKLRENSYDSINELYYSLPEAGLLSALSDDLSTQNDTVMMEVISVFTIISSVFMIFIILMTIRFTIIADLKNEEKEIGMMKAIGVDSIGFRWLFSAKYISFSIAGGIIGIAGGLPVSTIFINMFDPECILPERWQIILIGIIAVIAMAAIMIVFSLLIMLRINKISVIDAIHGENHGERFSRSSPVFLHRSKLMHIPSFLAVNEILSRFKRYIFLIAAYAIGAAMILIVFNVRNSVISPNYLKYWLMGDCDFHLSIQNDKYDEIHKIMEKNGLNYAEALNFELENAGIPAHVNFFNSGEADLHLNGKKKVFDMFWKKGVTQLIEYRKGGRMPVLPNEAAISSFTAEKLGIQPGEVITADLYECNDDNTGASVNTKEIVITALFDYMEDGIPAIIMGDDYQDGYAYSYHITNNVIDTDKSSKPAVKKQIEERFGEGSALTSEEFLKSSTGEFADLLENLQIVISITVILILILITYLYVNIFITEETSETALLKCLGFRNIHIILPVIIRMAILTAIALAAAELLIWTAGSAFFNAFMSQYAVTGMKLDFEFPASFLLIPFTAAAAILITTLLTLNKTRTIDIWNIAEE